MTNMKIIVNALPVGKARPRVVRQGNRVMTFTPKKTTEFEGMIREQVSKYPENSRFFDADVPLSISIVYGIPKPKSAPKKRLYPIVKPDLDNLNKSVLDALEKFAYKSDSQIVRIVAAKIYNQSPFVRISIDKNLTVMSLR